jgi:hypothetical protein
MAGILINNFWCSMPCMILYFTGQVNVWWLTWLTKQGEFINNLPVLPEVMSYYYTSHTTVFSFLKIKIVKLIDPHPQLWSWLLLQPGWLTCFFGNCMWYMGVMVKLLFIPERFRWAHWWDEMCWLEKSLESYGAGITIFAVFSSYLAHNSLWCFTCFLQMWRI